MKLTPVPVCLSALLLITGCARMKVTCEMEPDYDFSQIRTYQWVEPSRELIEREDTYLNKELQQALNNELFSRGWNEVLDAGAATIQVSYYVTIAEHQEYVEMASQSESEFAGGLVYTKGGWDYEKRGPETYGYTIETGSLIMIITDTASGKRVWRGTLNTNLDRSAPIEKQQELFQRAARKLLGQLPVKAK